MLGKWSTAFRKSGLPGWVVYKELKLGGFYETQLASIRRYLISGGNATIHPTQLSMVVALGCELIREGYKVRFVDFNSCTSDELGSKELNFYHTAEADFVFYYGYREQLELCKRFKRKGLLMIHKDSFKEVKPV